MSASTRIFGGYWGTNRFSIYFRRSTSAMTPNERSSINTNRKFTTRFSMNLAWTLYLAPKPPTQGWAQKRKTTVFSVKSHFAWRKSATKWGDNSKSKLRTLIRSLCVRRFAVAKRPCDCSCLIFACSASAVTLSANSSITVTRTGSPLQAFQWA